MHNHQFIRSKTAPNVPTQFTTNLVKVINSHKVVSVVHDIDKHSTVGSEESKIRGLAEQKSVNSIHNNEISIFGDVLCFRVKFFIVSRDYSCLLMVKSMTFAAEKLFNKELTMNSYQEQAFLHRKKSGYKKIEKIEKEGQQRSNRITRNVMSLDQINDGEERVQQQTSRRYEKILNTDQSHSFLDSLSPQNSVEALNSHRASGAYDKFDKEVYPPATEGVRYSHTMKRSLDKLHDLKTKRQLIDVVRTSHRDKINEVVSKKCEHLNHIK